MPDDRGKTENLQLLIDRLNAGDPGAVNLLFEHSMQRLLLLARTVIRGDRLRRWEETDDLYQLAMLGLRRAIEREAPSTARGFLALAAKKIREALLDLGRHHFGPEGGAAHHGTDPPGPGRDAPAVGAAVGREPDPADALAAREIHALVDRLPADEREVFDLLVTQGLSQDEAAATVGVSVPTIKRRFRAAKLLLHDLLAGPGG